MSRISPQVIAALGGASRQAVYKAGNPVLWLSTRLRRELLPDRSWRAQTWGYRDAKMLGAKLVKFADLRLSLLPRDSQGRSGRPLRASPRQLAILLEVPFKAKDTLTSVFARFVQKCLTALFYAMKGHWGQNWWRVRRLLDSEWLPRWVHRQTGVAPPSWEAYLAGRRKPAESPVDSDPTEGGKWLITSMGRILTPKGHAMLARAQAAGVE